MHSEDGVLGDQQNLDIDHVRIAIRKHQSDDSDAVLPHVPDAVVDDPDVVEIALRHRNQWIAVRIGPDLAGRPARTRSCSGRRHSRPR
jgi:hypothetical protein